MKIINENNPRITFEEELFINHKEKERSGHLGHAMVECKNGDILAFYSNCSGHRGMGNSGGHTMYGWVEYKRSTDRGITWSEPTVLDYSYDCFVDGMNYIGCEKCVMCDDGRLVLFCLRNMGGDFEPYDTPVYLISYDNGYTWSEPFEFSNERGRVFDAVYKDGKIYALQLCDYCEDILVIKKGQVTYKIFVSENNGESFSPISELTFESRGYFYGNLIFREDNSLVFYAYKRDDEYTLSCHISEDMGKTWGEHFEVKVDKIARNPQVSYLKGYYILQGRSENGVNFVFYHSKDAINWSEGVIVSELLDNKPRGGCYYSNTLNVVGDDGVERLLVQYSEQYAHGCARVNIMHAWIEISGM